MTAPALPVEHNPVVGAVARGTVLATPHTALTRLFAVQFAFDPPPDPLQDHVYVVAFVVTAVDVPALQRFVAGAVVNVPPFDVPHDPFTAHDGFTMEQDAFVPPPEPLQFQVRVVPHAVRPLSDAEVPEVQAPAVPEQAPLTTAASKGAEQDAVLPPPVPVQLQFHGPVPVTAVAVPAAHNPVVGADVLATPFAGPHEPLTGAGQVNLVF